MTNVQTEIQQQYFRAGDRVYYLWIDSKGATLRKGTVASKNILHSSSERSIVDLEGGNGYAPTYEYYCFNERLILYEDLAALSRDMHLAEQWISSRLNNSLYAPKDPDLQKTMTELLETVAWLHIKLYAGKSS